MSNLCQCYGIDSSMRPTAFYKNLLSHIWATACSEKERISNVDFVNIYDCSDKKSIYFGDYATISILFLNKCKIKSVGTLNIV